MLNSEKLLCAMTDIEDSYIEAAYEFQQKSKRSRLGTMTRRGAVAAVVALTLTGTTAVCAAVLLVRQLHVTSYDSVADLEKDQKIEPWNSAVPVTDGTFEEDVFSNRKAQSLINILSDAGEGEKAQYAIVNGTDADRWTRKLTEYTDMGYTNYEKVYYEAYEYENLTDALSEYGVALDLSYVQQRYPEVAGEYGCDFVYADAGKENCLQQRFFSGFMNGQGNFVSVEYAVDNVYTNEDPYVLFEGKADVSYYTTADGVEVFLTKATGTKGGSLITAEVYTEHGHLYVGMYGTFEEGEVEKILDSLHIADGMKLKQ